MHIRKGQIVQAGAFFLKILSTCY